MKSFLTVSLFLVVSFSQSQNNQCACCSEPYSGFDFWIGSWEVKNQKGDIVGYSSISKIQDSCILLEDWKAVNQVYTGTSYNTYNQATKQWEQLYIDNAGYVLKLKGNRKGNQMILASEPSVNDKGLSVLQRITWTANDDGTVRQLWETITDGKEVVVAFDGLYYKKDQ